MGLGSARTVRLAVLAFAGMLLPASLASAQAQEVVQPTVAHPFLFRLAPLIALVPAAIYRTRLRLRYETWRGMHVVLAVGAGAATAAGWHAHLTRSSCPQARSGVVVWRRVHRC